MQRSSQPDGLVEPAGQLEHRLLQHHLERVGDVEVPLLERPAPQPRRAEPLLQARRLDRVLARPSPSRTISRNSST